MAYALIQHSIEDYDKWRPVFDEDEPRRRANGSRGATVFRSADDPNLIIVLFEWDDLDNARAFASSPDLREKMERAGITGPPSMYFLEEIDRPSA